MRKVSYLSYNMTTADANNPDGIVPVGRSLTLSEMLKQKK